MRKYPIQEKFFDTIESEEQAYFLGLLFADGHNNVKDGIVSIDLQPDDRHILEKLTELTQPDKPIKYYDNKYSLKGRCRVVLANKYISSILEQKGMCSNKSSNLLFPTCVPEHLIHHFIRGYFDGDGSIGIYGKVKNVEFSLVSTKEFLLKLQSILINNCNLKIVKLGKRHRDRESNAYHIKYTGRFSCIRIRDWLYKDATIYLNRKFDKFHSIPDKKL